MLKNSLKSRGQGSGVRSSRLTSYVSRLTAVTLIVSCFFLLALIGGCAKEEVAPVTAAPAKKVVAPVQASMTAEIKPEYVYDSSGKRDPFKSFIDTEKKARPAAPATPLQSYDLNTLRLVGIMMLPGKKLAIIEDPSGKGYHVKVGTHIGLNDGVVVEILKDEVVVEESYLDVTAQTKARKVSIKIPKEQGQGGEVR